MAPSAIAVDGVIRTYTGKHAFPVPHALETVELPGIIEEFVTGSRNAMAAGFDGVELHGANGYLLHEFLAPSANTRTDAYGGSPENRARFVIEVITAVPTPSGRAARVCAFPRSTTSRARWRATKQMFGDQRPCFGQLGPGMERCVVQHE